MNKSLSESFTRMVDQEGWLLAWRGRWVRTSTFDLWGPQAPERFVAAYPHQYYKVGRDGKAP